MGCQISIEEVNKKIRESIDNLDYASLNYYLEGYNSDKLDPSLFHYAVQSFQIDIIAVFLENSIYYQISI